MEDGTEVYDLQTDKEFLTDDQRELLQDIQDQLNLDEGTIDLGIFYMVTGFKGGSGSDEFWDNFADFALLGDTNMIRDDKNEEIRATQKGGAQVNDQNDVSDVD